LAGTAKTPKCTTTKAGSAEACRAKTTESAATNARSAETRRAKASKTRSTEAYRTKTTESAATNAHSAEACPAEASESAAAHPTATPGGAGSSRAPGLTAGACARTRGTASLLASRSSGRRCTTARRRRSGTGARSVAASRAHSTARTAGAGASGRRSISTVKTAGIGEDGFVVAAARAARAQRRDE
jgi:hypothetical protein